MHSSKHFATLQEQGTGITECSHMGVSKNGGIKMDEEVPLF